MVTTNSQVIEKPKKNRYFRWVLAATGVILVAVLAQPVYVIAKMRMELSTYTPDLREKVDALSGETKMALLKILAGHNRPSDTLTFRQVMQEVLGDYQNVVAGIAVDNGSMAADSARRLANHRIPKGGLLPYFTPDKINDATLAALPGFNNQVEVNARRLADAAEKGDMVTAASLLGEIGKGCVGCHQIFRGQPGVSEYIKK